MSELMTSIKLPGFPNGNSPGPCHRYPPQVTARVGQVPFVWPVTSFADFCGEHQPKEPT